mmetsp:Transcript_17542/g.36842  ORF Transcript_17542/g.36842 Transcript_17542/m.36842 type:complete len:250 (+) Transcript_17542:1188-1937(+)
MHIFASLIVLFICGCEISLSMTIPLTSSVSSKEPPGFPSIRIISKLTSFLSKSATPRTALTAIPAIFRLSTLIIFELNVVIAVVTKGSTLSLVNSTLSAMESKVAIATSAAFSYPSAILTGWIPLANNFSACSSNAPARTTTPVVPSPISSSWEEESSTMSLETWWSTCMRLRMVAPSLVMVTSPSGETRILSMPLGPREERRILEMEVAARIFDLTASRPFTRALACCSFKMMKGRPYSSYTIDMIEM